MEDDTKTQNQDGDETEAEREQGKRSAQEASVPFEPHEEDDTALGDSDQHSTA